MGVGVRLQSGDLLLVRYLAFHTNYVQIVSLLSTWDSTFQMEELKFLEPPPVTESHVIIVMKDSQKCMTCIQNTTLRSNCYIHCHLQFR